MTKVERLPCGMVNCWLIKGENGSVLVDTAVLRYRDKLLERLKHQNVKLIFLTHGHTDHTGNAAYLSQKLGAPIGMAQADVELAHSAKPRKLYADTFLGRMILGGSERNIYKAPEFEVNRFFADGDSLAEFGVEATVASLPGHTAGSLAVSVGDLLLVGDAMFNIMKPTYARLYEEKETMLKSVEKIKTLAPQTILPGHGRAFSAAEFFDNQTIKNA